MHHQDARPLALHAVVDREIAFERGRAVLVIDVPAGDRGARASQRQKASRGQRGPDREQAAT